MTKVSFGLTYPQQVQFLEMVKECYTTEVHPRFNVNDRLQIMFMKEDKEDEVWDWFEFAVVMIPDLLSNGDNHVAFLYRMNMMEYIAPYKEYPGAPKFIHPITYLYTKFAEWKEKQEKKSKKLSISNQE